MMMFGIIEDLNNLKRTAKPWMGAFAFSSFDATGVL
jgi:hypothetical protein